MPCSNGVGAGDGPALISGAHARMRMHALHAAVACCAVLRCAVCGYGYGYVVAPASRGCTTVSATGSAPARPCPTWCQSRTNEAARRLRGGGCGAVRRSAAGIAPRARRPAWRPAAGARVCPRPEEAGSAPAEAAALSGSRRRRLLLGGGGCGCGALDARARVG